MASITHVLTENQHQSIMGKIFTKKERLELKIEMCFNVLFRAIDRLLPMILCLNVIIKFPLLQVNGMLVGLIS